MAQLDRWILGHPKEELAEIDEGKEDIVANKKDFFHVPWDKYESSDFSFENVG